MALKAERGERCVCLLGNHEDMLLDHWRRTRGRWHGGWTLRRCSGGARLLGRPGAGVFPGDGGPARIICEGGRM